MHGLRSDKLQRHDQSKYLQKLQGEAFVEEKTCDRTLRGMSRRSSSTH